jgi:hypothetical protein
MLAAQEGRVIVSGDTDFGGRLADTFRTVEQQRGQLREQLIDLVVDDAPYQWCMSGNPIGAAATMPNVHHRPAPSRSVPGSLSMVWLP